MLVELDGQRLVSGYWSWHKRLVKMPLWSLNELPFLKHKCNPFMAVLTTYIVTLKSFLQVQCSTKKLRVITVVHMGGSWMDWLVIEIEKKKLLEIAYNKGSSSPFLYIIKVPSSHSKVFLSYLHSSRSTFFS